MSRNDHENRRSDDDRQREFGHHSDYWQNNYWDDWRAERRHYHHEHHEGHGRQDPSAQDVTAWRDYFYQFFGVWPEDHWIFGGRRFGPWQQGMDSFNPFVATLLSKGGGLLPLYVLYLVSQKPRYGNEIMDILATRTNGQWVSNPGAIYPLLTQLEFQGFIRGEWADPAKRTVRTYSITPAGQKELDRLKVVVAPKIEETIQVLGEFLEDLRQTLQTPDTDSPAPAADPDSSAPADEK